MGGLSRLKLLLDTHVILWCAAEPERLSEAVTQEIERPSNELWYSPISVWEILILAEKGRISLGKTPEGGVKRILERLPMREAVLNSEVAISSRLIKLPHQDPADRFLAATAAVYNLTLVTADRRLVKADEYPVLAIE